MGRSICDNEINPRKQRIILTGEKDMTQEELYQQYLDEVSSFERYGSKNVITFDEWKWLKSIIESTRTICESELNLYKELLGHTTQDIDTLE